MKSVINPSYKIHESRRILIQLNDENFVEFYTAEDEDHLAGWKENYGDEIVAIWKIKLKP